MSSAKGRVVTKGDIGAILSSGCNDSKYMALDCMEWEQFWKAYFGIGYVYNSIWLPSGRWHM